MKDFITKVKNYFSTNFGKLSLIIMCLSFIVTLIFSSLFRNRIDVSIMRAFTSTIVTGIILYVLAIILKKFFADVIESSGVFDPSSVSASKENNNINELNELKDNIETNTSSQDVEKTSELDSLQASNVLETNSHDDIETSKTDTDSISSSIDSINNIDKNKKVDYHNTGDIGDIISSVTDNSNMEEISDYFPLKKESADAVNLEREVKEDPEKVAKAVRTMLAKEDKKESK